MDPASVPDLFFLDERERALVLAALDVARAGSAEQGEILSANLSRLARAADLIRRSPADPRSWETSISGVADGSLLEQLCRVPSWDLDLHIPTKAVLGQAYLVAKINFFKAVAYALERVDGPADLLDRAHAEIAQSIYSKFAEELFLTIVTDPTTSPLVKRSAARLLFRIWDERLEVEIDDFAPLLEAIWEARARVRPVFGTMRGTHEFFSLLKEARDHRFLDYFTEHDVPAEELQAFEEFVFGVPYEDIARLRDYLAAERHDCVSAEQARGVLGRRPESWAPAGGPQALYTSYKKRRLKATYRALTGAPGPKKTAEEYVMTAFFMAEGQGADRP